MIHSFKISDWKSLSEFLEYPLHSYKYVAGGYVYYRGQSDENWKLEPSLMRIVKGDEISEEKAKYYEIQAQMEFKSKFHILDQRLFYGDNAPLAQMSVDMQHYSCPTRLLDWTSSPYTALYFTVSENFNQDGAFYMWQQNLYDKKMRTLHGDNYVKISTEKIIEHTNYDLVTPIYALKKNERIVRQQGCFTISNNLLKSHCDLITEVFEENESSGLYKITIPKEVKLDFLARLKIMNITAESLFPGLDGLGRAIREDLLLRKWIKQ